MGSSLSHQSAVDTISHWRAKPTHDLIFDSGRRHVTHYFEAVDRLRHQSFPNDEFVSAAMARLSHEFASVLRRQADQQPGQISATEYTSATDSTAYLVRYEDYVAYEPPSRDAVDYLRNIARRMSSHGNLGECVGIYKAARKSFLRAELKRLRFDDLSLGPNPRRFAPDELTVKMEMWAQVCKICVEVLFGREKKLCDQIFQGLDGNFTGDECFVGTVGESAAALFNFADAVSSINQPYRRMENILGVYNSFVWVLPLANRLFDCESGKGVTDKCREILSKAENDVARMLLEFENTVRGEISSLADDRGDVHPSTVHVMDQIAIIVENKELLANLIKSAPSLDQHVIRILLALETNLQTKFRAYNNATLGQLFMMNNLRFMSRKVNDNGELREMMRESNVRKLDENLEAAMDRYKEFHCRKFLACFEEEGLYVTLCFKRMASKNAVRKRVKVFNALYEEFRDLHSYWRVPDSELREELRVSLGERLVPAYREFLDKFRGDSKVSLGMRLVPAYLEFLDKFRGDSKLNNVKYSGEEFEMLILVGLFA